MNDLNFQGAAFDGRYVHFVPYNTGVGNDYHSIAIRYDTQAAFASANAWTKVDVSRLDAHAVAFHYGAFDGRYVYFVPYAMWGDIARFDTRAARYDDPAAWSTFELTAAGFNAGGSIGAVFTGRHLYLVPYVPHGASRWVLRFDAKTPAALPVLPGHSGSFL